MGHGSTEEWRVFQERVADRFRRIPICRVTVGEKLKGAIANHEVDVVARIGSPDHNIVITVLIECKFWKNRVPQGELIKLKAIVDDVGADRGYLVSEVGHQKGKREYLDSPINVEALTLAGVEALTLRKIFEPRTMHVGVCSDCGRQITYPFSRMEGQYFPHSCLLFSSLARSGRA